MRNCAKINCHAMAARPCRLATAPRAAHGPAPHEWASPSTQGKQPLPPGECDYQIRHGATRTLLPAISPQSGTIPHCRRRASPSQARFPRPPARARDHHAHIRHDIGIGRGCLACLLERDAASRAHQASMIVAARGDFCHHAGAIVSATTPPSWFAPPHIGKEATSRSPGLCHMVLVLMSHKPHAQMRRQPPLPTLLLSAKDT
jgi:hypothetical protein